MDITDITDIKHLKALAYDQMVVLEQAQRNLNLISGRIAELEVQRQPVPESPQPAEAP